MIPPYLYTYDTTVSPQGFVVSPPKLTGPRPVSPKTLQVLTPSRGHHEAFAREVTRGMLDCARPRELGRVLRVAGELESSYK